MQTSITRRTQLRYFSSRHHACVVKAHCASVNRRQRFARTRARRVCAAVCVYDALHNRVSVAAQSAVAMKLFMELHHGGEATPAPHRRQKAEIINTVIADNKSNGRFVNINRHRPSAITRPSIRQNAVSTDGHKRSIPPEVYCRGIRAFSTTGFAQGQMSMRANRELVITVAHGHSQPQRSHDCFASLLGSNSISD
ncbi:hypothetical protein EVAR_38407_1 [Eumeta japonica]|uniref:Uncharacterized protein n=1 Tax=Eumeta variegata TaxID=151549 RepID=A0A4C1WY60_EUMVA|nr:hypothetical protein EVAR_38407_1 [Eumeta japonica]